MFLQNGDSVVSMNADKGQDGFPHVDGVVRYWNQLRRGQLVPYRSEVDPRSIEDALPYAFVAERVAEGLARLRIAGTHLNDLLGMETRGMPLSALVAPEDRARLSDAIAQLFDGPSEVRLSLGAERGLGKPALRGVMVLLPMRNDMGEIERILGCLETHGSVGRTPRRFGITDCAITPVVPHRLGGAPEVAVPAQHAPGFAEAQKGFRAARVAMTGEATKVPYLRVVKS